MSNPLDEYRTRLRESLGIINELKGKIAAYDRARTEPIALVGMACRVPGGGTSLDAFWNGLLRGVDGVGEVPLERWASTDIEAAGSEVRWAAFIDSIDQFDAAFFGISPREATSLDPQHRLLLEVTWEAIEDAAIRKEALLGSRTGVYVGISNNDYWHGFIRRGTASLDAYGATGNLFGTASGRLSYWLGLEGPCTSIDTACSSSLVALNLAYQSLRAGACDQAIVGGVNAILSPFSMTMVSRLGALSPDGRCKTFDARANGYVRGEGCGVVVLKRLSDARRDGDRIRAVILSSVINQDGRSTGLTTPNVLSQQALLRQALESARLSPDDINYIETHGTGTPLGDPIEFDALKAVFGQPRQSGLPCVLGALKTNIGHLESAAGIAGLIKAVLCLERETIPKNLHQRARNPRIDIEGTPFVIPRETTPWPRGAIPRRAGVSSFGIGGTNAHAILEEAPPEQAKTPTRSASAFLLPLSAKSPDALRALAGAYAEWFSGPNEAELQDIVYTASARRTHHEHRLAVVERTHEGFANVLGLFARNEAPAEIAVGHTTTQSAPRVLFVFSGQGSQWVGMGQTLLAQEPVFRAKVEKIDALVRRHASFSILSELEAPEERSRLSETEVVQPALFALQVGLADLFKSWGVVPNAVMGHSVGEVAAAHVCGALSLEDAVRLVVLRGGIMQKAAGNGKMMWVALPADDARHAIAGHEDRLAIAAINDPTSAVLSGEIGALEAVTAKLRLRGVVTRPVRVNYAFHSPQMDPLVRELVASLGRIDAKSGTIALYSTVTGERIDGSVLVPQYWGRNVRATVNFAGSVFAALRDGHRVLVEVGPHPVLLANIQDCISAQSSKACAISTLRRQSEERRAMLEALGAMHCERVEVDWQKLYFEGGRVVSLPAYRWQRERYWIESSTSIGAAQSFRSRSDDFGTHPLLGTEVSVSSLRGGHVFERRLRPDAPAYLQDHRVTGEVVFPGTGYLELAFAAAAELGWAGATVLEDVAIEQRLVLEESGALVQIVLEQNGTRSASFQIASRHDGTEDWLRHATGTVHFENAQPPEFVENANTLIAQLTAVQTSQEHYTRMQDAGLSYGPSFRGVEQISWEAGRALARIVLPESAQISDHIVHPALLDACFQAMEPVTASVLPGTYLPIGVDCIRLLERPGRAVWADIHLRKIDADNPDTAKADLRIIEEDGRILIEVTGLCVKRMAHHAPADPFDALTHTIGWRKKPLSDNANLPGTLGGTWLVFTDGDPIGEASMSALREAGARCIAVRSGTRFECREADEYVLDPANADDYRALLRAAFPAHVACRGILHAWNLEIPPQESMALANFSQDLQRGCISTIYLTQALVRFGWRDVPPLMLLTRAAQAAREIDSINVNQAPIWGLRRTIALEHPELACKVVDLNVRLDLEDARRVLDELGAVDKEDQIALRDEERLVARLVRRPFVSTNENYAAPREPARGHPYRLWQPEPGVLERLELRPIIRCTPGHGEVEVQVVAAGLNFIDALMAMGIYPGMKKGGTALGNEFAGHIVAVGEGVSGLFVGQEVMGSVQGAFSTHLIVRADFVVPKPSRLTFEEAASIPAVFTTVQYALYHVGRAQRGEKILIHSATGGTGLAAVQIARTLGLEVFATAGNDEKRDYLRRLGITHVMDSRSLDFADEITRITEGGGVDLVLNSLAGDAIAKGLELLAPYGRFLELGKRDIYDNERLRLLPFRKSLSYTAIDLAGMVYDKPTLYAALLREVVAKFENGTLDPLPVQTFPASRADEAFRLMAQARHIGKIVVTMSDPEARITRQNVPLSRIVRSDATYLITGGLGGLGMTVATWLVEKGARHLVLVGRSTPSKHAAAAIEALQVAGATVHTFFADVSHPSVVEKLVGEIDSNWPLRGIVHAAGVIEDHSLLEMSAEHVHRVAGPKIAGAWNLHATTLAIPLDFFVMYSSCAGLLGSPGQANYAAANVFLDALAQYRWFLGLPGMSIQWGPFSDVGMAAAADIRGGRAATRGIESMTPRQGIEVLDRLLAQPTPEIGMMRFNMRRFQEFYPQVVLSPFWSEVLASESGTTAMVSASPLRGIIETASPIEGIGLLERYLIEKLGRVLRLPTDRIGRETPFRTLGVDSLMSLEMRNRVETDLQLKLPSTLLFTYPDVASLAEHLLSRVVVPATRIDTPVESQAAVEPKNVVPSIDEKGADGFLAAFDASMEAFILSEVE